jgi:hypothetical protein
LILILLNQTSMPKLCSFSSLSHCMYENLVHTNILGLPVSFGEMTLYKCCECLMLTVSILLAHHSLIECPWLLNWIVFRRRD